MYISHIVPFLSKRQDSNIHHPVSTFCFDVGFLQFKCKKRISNARYVLHFFLGYSSTLKMEATCSSETSVHLNALHTVTTQKIEVFLTTAVKTSRPRTKLSVLYGEEEQKLCDLYV
jgi:hypothetical protein